MIVLRLCVWYALLSPFLNCPSQLSELNESSPRVCKPYIKARSQLEPHIRTYYNAYGAPYVDLARPYAQTVNERVYSPGVEIAKNGYGTYAAPVVEQIQKYGHDQWEGQLAPRLDSVRESFDGVYKTNVDPYVQQVSTELAPYIQKINSHISDVHKDFIYPFYTQSGPFIGKTYTSGQDVLATMVFPYAGGAWSSTVYFVNDSLLPTITSLYSKNVEPQLVKIGQKLASYKEGSKLRTVTDESDE